MSQPDNAHSKKSILRNFSFLTIGKILGDALTFILFVSLSRVFGQEALGQYSIAIAIAGFFAVFADFGLYFLSIKEMSRKTDAIANYIGGIISVRLILTLSTILIMLPLLLVLPYAVELKLIIAILILFQIMSTLIDGIATVFVAHEDMHLSALSEFTLKALSSIAALIAIGIGLNLVLVLAVMPAIACIHLVVVYIVVTKKYWRPQLSISWNLFRSTIINALPYVSSEFLRQLSTRIDVIAIAILLTVTSVGIYNAAYRIVFMLLFLPYFAGLALFPLASRLFIDSKEELKSLYNKALNGIILIAIPIAVGLCFIANDLVPLVYGDEFTGSSYLLQILSFIILFVFLHSIAGNFLTATDQQTLRTKSQWIAAVINIAGNFLLISIMGIEGAAISTLVSEGGLLIFYIINLKNLLGWPKITSRLLMSSIASATFIIPFTLLPTMHIAIIIPFSVILYAVSIAAFKDIRQNELKMLIEYIAKK